MTWLSSPLKTERLHLRPLADGDEVPIASLFSDPEVRRYLGGPLSREQAESCAGRESGIDGQALGCVCLVRGRFD